MFSVAGVHFVTHSERRTFLWHQIGPLSHNPAVFIRADRFNWLTLAFHTYIGISVYYWLMCENVHISDAEREDAWGSLGTSSFIISRKEKKKNIENIN